MLEAPGVSLRPVMSLKARVVLRPRPACRRASLLWAKAGPRRGLRRCGRPDRIRRRRTSSLVRQARDRARGWATRPLAGTVTMDQIVVDCGRNSAVEVGDEVVLIGRQGGASLSASDWANALGTISYEVLCGIGPRVPRVVVGQRGRTRGGRRDQRTQDRGHDRIREHR